MGYLTKYRLTFTASESEAKMFKLLYSAGEVTCKSYQEPIKDILDWYNEAFVGEDTWYEHENDMLEISKNFPNILFKLEGDGQDREDIWVKYFKNGQVKTAKILIVEEDPDLEDWD
jgi:hypothetical protein